MMQSRPEQVRLLVLDVDGVLTDGGIYIDDRGCEFKKYHVRDGAGLSIWRKLGRETAILTGRSSTTVNHRSRELRIRHVRQGLDDKAAELRRLLEQINISPQETAVIGDDLPDLSMMELAGYPIAVADAAEEIKAIAAYVTSRPGGQAAVREAIEHLLKSSGQWQQAVEQYRTD